MVMDREACVYSAKLAEQFERYTDMVAAIKQVAMEGFELTVEERNLLSVAYKNVIGARRSSWRIISAVEDKEKKSKDKCDAKSATKYRELIEGELDDVATEILDLITTKLLPTAKAPDSKVFYLKMKGDYYRYKAEYSVEAQRVECSEKSDQAYKEATEIAATELATTHPIRLGLALNYSVFYYEILNKRDQACQLARKAFDEAIAELDQLSEESYKDSTLIMQLLRDNLTLWASDTEADDETTKANDDKA